MLTHKFTQMVALPPPTPLMLLLCIYRWALCLFNGSKITATKLLNDAIQNPWKHDEGSTSLTLTYKTISLEIFGEKKRKEKKRVHEWKSMAEWKKTHRKFLLTFHKSHGQRLKWDLLRALHHSILSLFFSLSLSHLRIVCISRLRIRLATPIDMSFCVCVCVPKTTTKN